MEHRILERISEEYLESLKQMHCPKYYKVYYKAGDKINTLFEHKNINYGTYLDIRLKWLAKQKNK